jgi:hypothetical protein
MSDQNPRCQPNYDLMSPELGQATRNQLEGFERLVTELGPVVSIWLMEVGPQGADQYEAR